MGWVDMQLFLLLFVWVVPLTIAESCELANVFEVGDVGKSFRKEMCRKGEDVPGDVLPLGETMTCRTGFPADLTDISCCEDDSMSLVLTIQSCEGSAKTSTRPPIHEKAQKCGATPWRLTKEGPQIMGGSDNAVDAAGRFSSSVAILKDFVETHIAQSDEECKVLCCEAKECWGIVRNTKHRKKCWLLFLPISEVRSGTSTEYYMEAKPAQLITQLYPLALPYVVPMTQTEVYDTVVKLQLGSDAYSKTTYYERESLKRSNLGAERLSEFQWSYLAMKGAVREELRITFGGSFEDLTDECGKLEAVVRSGGRHVARCFGTGGKMPNAFQQIEYVGARGLYYHNTFPKEALWTLMKQILLAHLEVLTAGYVQLDGMPESFAMSTFSKEEMKIFGFEAHESLALKLVDLRTAAILSDAETGIAAGRAALTSIFALLGPEGDQDFRNCVVEKQVAVQDVLKVEMLTSALLNCTSTTFSSKEDVAVESFVKAGGPDMMLPLFQSMSTKIVRKGILLQSATTRFDDGIAVIKAALASEFMGGRSSPLTTDRRIMLARAFDVCEREDFAKDEVRCLTGSADVAEELGCEPDGVEIRGGFHLFASRCLLKMQQLQGKEQALLSQEPQEGLREDVTKATSSLHHAGDMAFRSVGNLFI